MGSLRPFPGTVGALRDVSQMLRADPGKAELPRVWRLL